MKRLLLAAIVAFFATPAAALDTVPISGTVLRSHGRTGNSADPCRNCTVHINYADDNAITASALVITDHVRSFKTGSDGTWTTGSYELVQAVKYRFQIVDGSYPEEGAFYDKVHTTPSCSVPCAAVDLTALSVVTILAGGGEEDIDHGILAGLLDGCEDHPGVVCATGDQTISGEKTFNDPTHGIDYNDLDNQPVGLPPAPHLIAGGHSDTSATGAELDELTDGSTTSLHAHALPAHTVASHSDTTATGAQLNTLVGGGATALHSHDPAAHDIEDHPDTSATGAELETLTDGSNADALHAHLVVAPHAPEDHTGTDITAAELEELSDGSTTSLHVHAEGAHTIASHSDTSATGAELNELTDGSETTLHGHEGEDDWTDDATSIVIQSGRDLSIGSSVSVDNSSGTVDAAAYEVGGTALASTDLSDSSSITRLGPTVTTGEVTGVNGGTDLTADLEEETHASEHGEGGADPLPMSTFEVGDLSDFSATSPSLNQVPRWTGSEWAPSADGVGSSNVGDLADVTSGSESAGDILINDGVSEYVNKPISGDATLSASGALSLANNSVDTVEIVDGAVNDAKITGPLGLDLITDDSTTTKFLRAGGAGGDPNWDSIAGGDLPSANAMDSELHDAVTLAGTPDYITLSGQVLTRNQLDLTADVSGVLPDANVSDTVTIAAGASVSVEAAEISDLHASTDITADLEEETHASEHQSGGADEISVAGLLGELSAAQKVAVTKDGAATIGTRTKLNFLDTSPIEVTVADDAGGGKVDVTIACSTCGTGDNTLIVQEGDATLSSSIDTLDFGSGFDLTETPSGEANIVLDYTEDPPDLSTSETTGTLAANRIGNGLTDAQVDDDLTISSDGSVHEDALPSAVVLEDDTYTKTTGVATFGLNTIALANDEISDAEVVDTLTASNYLPLAGGNLTGNVTADALVTIDGVDIGVHAADAGAHHTKTTSASELTSGTIPDAQLPSEAMLSDTVETVTAVHTYTGRPAFNSTGAPFTLGGGTDKVTNLDADLLDGEEASAFADASHVHVGSDITSGEVGDSYIPSAITRDTEWDTAAEINSATTDDDFVTLTGAATLSSGTKTLTAKLDAGGGTIEVPNSTTLPATCAVGDLYMDTDATSGQRLYLCESANTWVVQGDGPPGSGTTLEEAYDNGGRTVGVDLSSVVWSLTDDSNDWHKIIDNASTGTIASALEVTTTGSGAAFTVGVDLDDADIVHAFSIGSNSILTTTGTVTEAFFSQLINGINMSEIVGGTSTETLIIGSGGSLATSGTGTITATALETDGVNAITEIAEALKSGSDLTLMTGTAGADGNLPMFNSDGDLVDSGLAGGGDNIAVDGASVVDPDFDSGGDIDFVNASNTVTGNLNADVIDASHLSDNDFGDFTVLANVVGLDDGTVNRDEIDESEFSIQTHATDCTALTCDAGSDGEPCLEIDDDALYLCDGGEATWKEIGGGGGSGITPGASDELESATVTDWTLDPDTSDGSDAMSMCIAAGGTFTTDGDRGAGLCMYGEDHASNAGDLNLVTGDTGSITATSAQTLNLRKVDSTGATENQIYITADEVRMGSGHSDYVTMNGSLTLYSPNEGIYLEGTNSDSYEGFLTGATYTADRTYTFPNATGEVSLLGQTISAAEIVTGTVGRTQIDEALLSIQTHATDCTSVTCDAGSDGEQCFEIDEDALYICDGGEATWKEIGGGGGAHSASSADTLTNKTLATDGTGNSFTTEINETILCTSGARALLVDATSGLAEVMTFDQASVEYSYCSFRLPDDFDSSKGNPTITLAGYGITSSSCSADEGAVFDVDAKFVAPNSSEQISGASYGTADTFEYQLTCVVVTVPRELSEHEFTLNGTDTAGDWVHVRIKREAGDAGDDYGADYNLNNQAEVAYWVTR